MDRWLESVKLTIRPSTYRRYEQISRQHIVPTLGRIRLVRLTPDQVHKPLNERLESGLSARSVQHILGCLRSALSQAISWQIVQRNVASLVTPPRAVPHEIQPFTPEEAKETAGKTGRRDVGMLALILSLILVIVVFGLGFAMKALFWVALALLIIWVIGFLVGRGRRRRWYW